jgi:hypothetical protein
MRRLFALSLMLVTVAAPALAGDPLPWGGVGWYVKMQGTYEGAQPFALSGPYAERQTCDAEVTRYKSQNGAPQGGLWCNYETVPWPSPPPDED